MIGDFAGAFHKIDDLLGSGGLAVASGLQEYVGKLRNRSALDTLHEEFCIVLLVPMIPMWLQSLP